MSTYYKATLEMAVVASNPQAPPAVKDVAEQIIRASNEVMDRTLRAFDQIRDPETFLVDMDNAVNQVQGPAEGLQGLAQLFAALGQQEQGQFAGVAPAPAFGSA
jgi:hypothetical protein